MDDGETSKADDELGNGSEAAASGDMEGRALAEVAAPSEPTAEPAPNGSWSAPWQVKVDVAESICYALAHNRTPIIHSLKIIGLDPPKTRHLQVTISSAWAREGRPPIETTTFSIEAPDAGDTIELSPVNDARLDHVALGALESTIPAEIAVTVSDGIGGEQRLDTQVQIYARNQWLSDPRFIEITAAFVQPNHPDVPTILSGASRRMGARGQSTAISGYQAGPQHVVEIAQAVYEELSTYIDNYINPPADLESLGQQVRPLDQVLAERQGTCIDLACAYASCIRGAGLFPVVVMVRGHAFPGVILEEQQLNRTYIDSWPEVQSLLDSGIFFGVESTQMANSAPFSDALADVRSNYIEEKMLGVLDVSKAQREGVKPLPAQVRRGDELVIVIDNGPSEPPVIERRDPTTRKLLPDAVPARVQSWKNSLLDLSFRNRLLNLRVENSGVRLLPPIGKLGAIEDILANGDPLVIAPADALNAVQLNSIPAGKERIAQNLADDLWQEALRHRTLFSTLATDSFRTRSMRMRADARVLEDESGANNLYLALGSVKWAEKYGNYRSPVFLVPIRMRIGRGDRILTILMDETQSTVPNYCLVEALRMREQLSLPWFGDDMSDDFGLDVDAGLEALRKEFRDRGLDAQGFSVDQTASLALLDFKKFRLWKDLSEHWKSFAEKPVVKHLIETPRLTFTDPAGGSTVAVDDTTLLTPQPADGSQLRAVARALAGQSFVLEGPPGTGKSQTITNLLANAMRQGKKVLFVAEKQAALGVVYERLQQVGLGPYCLQLHDRGTKPDEFRTQLKDALEHQPTLDEKAFELLEEEFAVAARQLDQYRQAVHSVNDAGFSFASAHSALISLGTGPTADVPRATLLVGPDGIGEIRRRLLELPDVAAPAQPRPNHPWQFAGKVDFETIPRAELSQLVTTCAALAVDIEARAEYARELLSAIVDHESLRSAGALLQLLEHSGTPAPNEWTQIAGESWAEEAQRLLDAIDEAVARVADLVPGHEQLARRDDLGAIAADVEAAAGSFAIGRKGRVKAALRELAALAGPEKEIATVGPKFARDLSAAAEALRTSFRQLAALPGWATAGDAMPVVPAEVVPLRERAALLRSAALLVGAGHDAGVAARKLLGGSHFPVPGLAEAVSRLAGSMGTLVGLLGGDEDSVRQWCSGRSLLVQVQRSSDEAWREDAVGSFLRLQRWLSFNTHLDRLREAHLEDLCHDLATGRLDAGAAAAAFERGVLTTTIKVRAEEKNLDVFDRIQHDRKIARFIELLDKRREMARSVVPYELAGSRKVQGGIAVGRIGEFRRLIARPPRGRGKSIRHLITTYPEIVTDLVPCFLMSPDSVAQFVPPGSVDFDIAVFDEASQVVVADAVGVLGRASSVVIVGDSRQMPPTRFGVAGGADSEDVFAADEDAALVDEESILDEALQAGFDPEWLSWHYRSQDESLIEFSNVNYYDSRLATFPSPSDRRPDCGVFHRRVNGQFDHGASRTNPIEAKAIVDEIVLRLNDSETASLTFGIITLNIQQRRLVESILDSHEHPRIRELRETEDPEKFLFVLNLENVQGRERDVIVMGTSFSRRANGTDMPLNFGPLTQQGGEKRLNVAVTRARRQFVIVSSFDSSEIKEPKSLGMMHLRDYLAQAEQRTSTSDGDSSLEREAGSDVLHRLAQKLTEQGLRVQLSRGASSFKVDLALSLPDVPDRWLVAVLLDGKEWNDRPLVADRDALPTVILRTMMGWPRVARVWLPSWLIEPEQVIADLVELTHSAANDPAWPPPAPPAPEPAKRHADPDIAGLTDGPSASDGSDAPTPDSPAPETPLVGQESWTAHADPRDLGTAQDLRPGNPAASSLARAIVECEGPILADDVIRRVANAFGLARVRAARLLELSPILAGVPTSDLGEGVFCWPTHRDDRSWRGFRLTTSSERSLNQIAPEEMINLMEAITHVGFGISRADLVRETATKLGNRRLTPGIHEHLDRIVQLALSQGRLTEDGDILVVPGR